MAEGEAWDGEDDESAAQTGAFAATLRGLAADANDGAAGLALASLAAALLAAAAGCFLMMPVPEVERALEARVEAAAGAVAIVAPAGGQVAESRLEGGRTVRAGDLLLRLAAAPQALAARRQEQARAAALGAQEAALARELAAARRGAGLSQRAAREAAAAAGEDAAAAGQAAALAQARSARWARLLAAGAASAAQAEQARGEAAERETDRRRSDAATRRLQWESAAAQSDRRAALAEIESRLDLLRADRAAAEAAAARWQAELASARVLAPSDGELVPAAALPAGSTVSAGQPVARLVQRQPQRLVALIDAGALDRLRVGEPARFWLQSCPPLHCRGLPAVVTAIAPEAPGGRVRVELAPLPPSSPPGTASPPRTATPPAGPGEPLPRLRPGLVLAELEIEVGRTSPFALFRRGDRAPAGR